MAKKMTKLQTVRMFLSEMEKLKDHPDRDKYFYDFQANYDLRKAQFEKIAGMKWEDSVWMRK